MKLATLSFYSTRKLSGESFLLLRAASNGSRGAKERDLFNILFTFDSNFFLLHCMFLGDLSGTLPAELGQLTQLTFLGLAYTALSGTCLCPVFFYHIFRLWLVQARDDPTLGH